MAECLQPDLSPVVDPIYEAIREWFPQAKEEDCEELAFSIAHDVLHLKHVAGELWAATVPVPGEEYPLLLRE